MAGKKNPRAVENGFCGFGPKALSFFKALAFHQDKDWFLANKDIYESDIKGPLTLLLNDLTAAFAAHGIPLAAQGGKSIFRIHRDIRFSKDKSPYKTHAGATLTRDGAKMSPGLFYLHVAPEESFAAAGFYQPEPADLAAIRNAIASSPSRWQLLESRLANHGLQLSGDDRVSRLPKGFDADAVGDVAEAIKLKSFIVRTSLTEHQLLKPELVDDLAAFAEKALPLLDFGWSAIDRRKAMDVKTRD